ncbi:MAG: replication protein [Chloroflexi bacterium]|nr:replication protein [Chloroflexota bacterium]
MENSQAIAKPELSEKWQARLEELQQAANRFKTSLPTNPNTTQYPDYLLDWIMPLLSSDEFKVLSYVVRHTLGYRKQLDQISVDQFEHGVVKRNGERLDGGCGLNYKTIRKALTFLCGVGIIIAQPKGGPKATTYTLNDGQGPSRPLNLAALVARKAAWEAKHGPRLTTRAGQARAELASLKAAQRLTMQDASQTSQRLTAEDASVLQHKTLSVLQHKNTTPTTTPTHNNNAAAVVDLLRETGLDQKTARKLAKQYDPARVAAVVAAAGERASTNRAGWIVKALAEGWDLGESEAAKRRAEQEADNAAALATLAQTEAR